MDAVEGTSATVQSAECVSKCAEEHPVQAWEQRANRAVRAPPCPARFATAGAQVSASAESELRASRLHHVGAMIVLVVLVPRDFLRRRWFGTRAMPWRFTEESDVAVQARDPTVADISIRTEGCRPRGTIATRGDQTTEIQAAREPGGPIRPSLQNWHDNGSDFLP